MSPTQADPASPSRPLVLVVDDQPINIQTLWEILKADHEVCMATGGVQAIALCESRLPDLVLLDVLMTDMNGFDVCRQLKADARTAHIPIIFVTAQNDVNEEVRALDEGAADFISKPFHEKVVRARVRTQLMLKRQADSLRALATTDGLTGIPNRRQFDRSLAEQWTHCIRSGTALSVVMVDIDHFKSYNDRYGHPAGDTCIQAVARTLRAQLHRPHDLVARYGGEEFGILLPYTHLPGAHDKATELETAIRALGIPHESSDIAPIVTASFGVATMAPVAEIEPGELVRTADRMLYAAKQAGRGRVHSMLESTIHE